MSTTKNTTATTTATEEVKSFKATVKEISLIPDYGESRIMINTDVEFDSFDKEGQPTRSTSMGVSNKNLFNAECDNKVFNLVKRMRVNRTVAPEILGLLLVDAEIEFTRQLVHSGETFHGKLNDNGDIYGTTIVKVTPKCKDYEAIIMSMMKDWYIQPQQKPVVNIYENV